MKKNIILTLFSFFLIGVIGSNCAATLQENRPGVNLPPPPPPNFCERYGCQKTTSP
jgi:hypothetical protein